MKLSAFRHVIGYSLVLVIAIMGTAQALPGTNTVTSDDIVNGQVKKADVGFGAIDSARVVDGSLTGADVANGSLTGADLKDHSVTPSDLSGQYYTKAQINTLLASVVHRSDLRSVSGVLRWAYIRDLGVNGTEVYVDDSSNVIPRITVNKTGTGVYDVTVPGVKANGGWHGIWVSPQQGQTTIFRACKTFQTGSLGDPADTVVVHVRCYDAAATLSDTDFSILVLQ
jgi:uncharacterized protein YjbI with pentapeptide repeats